MGLCSCMVLKCVFVFGSSCIRFWVCLGDLVSGLKLDLVVMMVSIRVGDSW